MKLLIYFLICVLRRLSYTERGNSARTHPSADQAALGEGLRARMDQEGKPPDEQVSTLAWIGDIHLNGNDCRTHSALHARAAILRVDWHPHQFCYSSIFEIILCAFMPGPASKKDGYFRFCMLKHCITFQISTRNL